ncbi:MAG: methyltransferase [bacterium]|nr:methyltransferase [bacterium]
MKINTKFYDGKDNYSDGSIEDTILEFIKKYPDNYELAFRENNSWPVIYHLSDVRKNIVRWYPFKKNSSILEIGAGMGAITDELCRTCGKVTSVELSKKRASAIAERNKNKDDLEIIVGNFKKIKFKEKYDYILLIGVFEYAALYMNSKKPYIDFINKLKQLLKPNGKILIAIENRFGLKYWCGANEDHTNIMFDGINGYDNKTKVKTFSKKELEIIIKECNLKSNFYYVFPDYKFPQLIYTDKSLKENIYCNYDPYYSTNCNTNLVINESKVYKDIYNNKEIPFFANSYFLELSIEDSDLEIEFVKFNNYRKAENNLFTYSKNNKFYKKNCTEKGKNQIINIIKINEIMNQMNIKHLNVEIEDNIIYTKKHNLICLYEKLKDKLLNRDIEGLINEYDKLFEYFKTTFFKGKYFSKNNIFNKYNINVSEKALKSMHFCKKTLMDIIPSNVLIDSVGDYVLMDQEWYEENVPVEYVMYRAIVNFFCDFPDYKQYMTILFKRYNIPVRACSLLDNKFLYNLYSDYHISFSEYTRFNKLNSLNDFILEKRKKDIEYDDLFQKYNIIINSRGWKLLTKIKIILKKLKLKK